MPQDEEWIWHGKPKRPVYPVLRVQPEGIEFDRDDVLPDGLLGIDIPQVLPTYEEAQAEAARLNELNGHKGYRYYALASRFYPEGRAGT